MITDSVTEQLNGRWTSICQGLARHGEGTEERFFRRKRTHERKT